MSDEDVYTVEAVVNHRVTQRGETEYYLKWKDYPSSENTWETEKDVYAKDLIQQYWKEIESKTSKTPRSSSRAPSKRKSVPADENKNGAKTENDLPHSSNKKSRTSAGSSGIIADPTTKYDDEYQSDDLLTEAECKEMLARTDWENLVDRIETVDRDGRELMVHVRWANGKLSFHENGLVNAKCPQKMIKFYEDHLKFRPASS